MNNHNFIRLLKPLRGLGLFLLITCVIYGLMFVPFGSSLGAGLAYILTFVVSLILCFRMTVRDVKTIIRKRKEARFNRNFEQACKEVTDIVHLTPMGSCTFQEHFKIWDDYSISLFESITDFLYSKKGFLSRNLYLQPVPTCAKLVNRLTKMVQYAQTLRISQHDRIISFNCGRPVNFDDIIEINVVTDAETQRSPGYTQHATSQSLRFQRNQFNASKIHGSSSERGLSVTTFGKDLVYTKYCIMISINSFHNPLQSLSFGYNREMAYKVYSLIKALKYNGQEVTMPVD